MYIRKATKSLIADYSALLSGRYGDKLERQEFSIKPYCWFLRVYKDLPELSELVVDIGTLLDGLRPAPRSSCVAPTVFSVGF